MCVFTQISCVQLQTSRKIINDKLSLAWHNCLIAENVCFFMRSYTSSFTFSHFLYLKVAVFWVNSYTSFLALQPWMRQTLVSTCSLRVESLHILFAIAVSLLRYQLALLANKCHR